jgi:hypothetical protein
MNKLTMLTLLGAASVWGAQADYFPLEAGNQWVLQTQGPNRELLTVEVLRSRVENDRTYFLVSGYTPGARWIRQTPEGALVAIDELSGDEQTLARLTPGGGEYKTALSGCEQLGQPFAATAPHRGANFDLPEALTIAYQPLGCRDVGIQSEVYAPSIGLVRRSITTIRGELSYDLVYARVHGEPVLGKSKEIVLHSDFNGGSKGWLAGFTDYTLRTGDLRMLAELRPMPQEIDTAQSGFYVQGMNRSDDLFMFLKKHVASDDGIEPNQTYLVSFDIRMASNAPSGCSGVGGAPGESVYLKAGASADEPLAVLAENGEIRISVDKGQQSQGGTDAGVVGSIANGTACEGPLSPYVRIRREYAHPHLVRTDDRGSMWLVAGTDSAYEGLTGLYFESITVRINLGAEAASARRIRGRR